MKSIQDTFRTMVQEAVEPEDGQVLEAMFVVLTAADDGDKLLFGGINPAPPEARIAMLSEVIKEMK